MPTDNSINIVDLFAGCGGLTQGFHTFRAPDQDGTPFRTVGAVEHDQAAASTYAANFGDEVGPERIHAGDIEDWDPSHVEDQVDVILGGPPCQGFSAINKKNLIKDLDDERNVLWREYVKVVNQLKPKVFVIENVARFLKSAEFTLLQEETEKPDGLLREYQLTEAKVLNAADYGVPQARRRAFVLATRRDIMDAHPHKRALGYPEPTHAKNAKAYSPQVETLYGSLAQHPWETVESVFGRTPPATLTNELPDRFSAPLGIPVPGVYRTSDLHIGRSPEPLSLERYKAIPRGGNRKNLPPELSTESWMRHKTGSGDVMGRLHIDKPSVTIRTEFFKPEKGRYLHPTEHRPITHLEAAYIQGFPDDYKWCGSKLQIARQIGNAVPVGLAAALAGAVYRYLAEVDSAARPFERTVLESVR